MFEAIVMADERWVAGLGRGPTRAGMLSAAGLRRPPGPWGNALWLRRRLAREGPTCCCFSFAHRPLGRAPRAQLPL